MSVQVPKASVTIPVNVMAVLQTTASPPTPIANEPFDFQHKLSSLGIWMDDGTFTTDATGTAKLPAPLQLVAGQTYDFQAIFAGDPVKGIFPSTGKSLGFPIGINSQVVITVTF